jgi:activator of 2-hydroxyglutaryl-CoA dehydratase/predicted nucleotide-binding protein (sugar kinase/HSP70/actin superfamily)
VTDISLDKKSCVALYVDAGIETTRCYRVDEQGRCIDHRSFSSSSSVASLNESFSNFEGPVFVTGKLQKTLQPIFDKVRNFSLQAVLWSAAQERADDKSVVILNLSASGYLLVGIDSTGQLKDDLLSINPRCGSGSGINLDRVLRKLSIERHQVDTLLTDYLGSKGQEQRETIPIRADRCGVFASSATISDKNQGIPIAFALATTLKSEVVKACKQVRGSFDQVLLTGGVFRWKFARDCAADYFNSIGITSVEHDDADSLVYQGLKRLSQQSAESIDVISNVPAEVSTQVDDSYPGFSELRSRLKEKKLFKRLSTDRQLVEMSEIAQRSIFIAIDVGSTMAKVVVSPTDDHHVYYRRAYSNAGDTVETIQVIFRGLLDQGIDTLVVDQVGITGSARFQVREALAAVYPELDGRIQVLVENYAHARGSVTLAHQYIDELEQQGIKGINKKQCLLVDVGGEDTKISSIDLEQGDLYDNAMNTKCSAGTGSLFDTLVDLFSLDDIEQAIDEVMAAPRAFSLNATCAVFLLESARRLQAEGWRKDEILASAVWAIAENMARSLWPQIHMAEETVVLLHGQTMQSDPLPLAITERLQSHIGGPAYCIIPDDPGYRACLGLIQTMTGGCSSEAVSIPLTAFINQTFSRQIIQCRGAACGDSGAHCYRSKLSANDALGNPFSIFLGGCAAINETVAERSSSRKISRDSCRDIWQFQASQLPTSQDTNRLVIPRSFAVSEWAQFFVSLFEPCQIPVHVDLPITEDILRGQPHFRIDTCAPHIGLVGQMLRLAEQPHGIILAPQIEFIPGKGKALGRTCTVNQGGFATAQGVAQSQFPDSRFALFHIDLKAGLEMLAHKLYARLLPVYKYYDVEMLFDDFVPLIRQAMEEQRKYRFRTAEYAAELAREALHAGQKIAIVVGREYILNPGVYDSHIGRLLRDKGLVGIPSYVLGAECSDRYAHLYWRNAQLITSIVDAVTQKRLHEIIPHKGLKKVIGSYEKLDELLPIVQVSTFLCGPDSVTNPLISNIAKNRPFLRIQSDAAIKELAHLENRMNTYVHQLAATGHQQIETNDGESFEVELLNSLENQQTLDPETDIISFPTLSDNRALLAVLRSAGFDCLENYTDHYSLQSLIERGRAATGDSVCAPLAAVYGDVLNAISSFHDLRETDPRYRRKKRLLIFNNKGLGPCRQGQYVEAHKLFLTQSEKHRVRVSPEEEIDQFVQFLVAHENEGFKTGFPAWVYLRGVQAAILQGVLHQLLADGSSRCHDNHEYREFVTAYEKLKQNLFQQIETRSAPSPWAQRLVEIVEPVPGLRQFVRFFAWGFYRNHLASPLSAFRKRWCREPLTSGQIKIHIDGEAYMRTAQFEDLHQALLELLGVGRFHLTYTPLWGFLEYKLAGMMMRAKEGIAESRSELSRGGDPVFIQKRRKFLRKKQKRYVVVAATHFFLRKVLAAPLYRSAGICMPESLTKVLAMAKRIIPTRRPGGELIPYVGEAALKLEKGYDLVLNVAPEGCMVSSMGEVITPAIYRTFPQAKGKIQPIFSQQGDIDREKLEQALLQALGTERVYRRS